MTVWVSVGVFVYLWVCRCVYMSESVSVYIHCNKIELINQLIKPKIFCIKQGVILYALSDLLDIWSHVVANHGL